MVLRLDSVSCTFAGPHGPVAALKQVSLGVEAGELAVVTGPSGSGKSTLLLVAGGLLHPAAGSVEVDGQTVYGLSPKARAGLRATRIGFVFQRFHLVPYLSVRDNVLAALVGGCDRGGRERAEELLTRFGLVERADHLPSALSTGERQRTALARALLPQPRLLLADEPTGNLDDANAAVVQQALRDFAAAGGGVVLATHDPRIAGEGTPMRLAAGCLTR